MLQFNQHQKWSNLCVNHEWNALTLCAFSLKNFFKCKVVDLTQQVRRTAGKREQAFPLIRGEPEVIPVLN